MLIFDFTFFVYVWTVCVSFYGFGIFVYWWARQGQASHVYIYTTLILLFIAYAHTVAGTSRVFYLMGDYETMNALLGSIVWKFRTLPLCIVLTVLVVHMSIRLIRNKK